MRSCAAAAVLGLLATGCAHRAPRVPVAIANAEPHAEPELIDVPGIAPRAREEPDDGRPDARARSSGLRWPLKGVLYSRYGVRQGQPHDGIDIAAPEGTAIGAAAAGSVLYAGEQSGYGWIVILKHPTGLLTLYAHASAVLVRTGDHVDAGQPVARVGRSGRTTGPHLHFEVREGARPRNPLLYLP